VEQPQRHAGTVQQRKVRVVRPDASSRTVGDELRDLRTGRRKGERVGKRDRNGRPHYWDRDAGQTIIRHMSRLRPSVHSPRRGETIGGTTG
jgi:hypothetical protein